MSAADQPFTASSHERRKLLREKIVRRLMLASALALIIPVVTVIVYLFVKAAPVPVYYTHLTLPTIYSV